MSVLLNAVEVRVLGSLIEKQLTTPEYYPLTLNALTHACNQTSNRDPVVHYDEKTIARALETLREKQLVWMVTAAGSRVPKYEHRVPAKFNLLPPEVAALCVLMLRGPQTVGEIKGRAGRMYDFKDLQEAEQTLEALCTRPSAVLATKLPRQVGMKESRFAHLLAGPVEFAPVEQPSRVDRAVLEVREENTRIENLEAAIELLRNELTDLREQFVAFKKQFE